MAKGYPAPRALDVDYPVLDDVLAEDVCTICKKRPRATAHGLCADCDAALHGSHGDASGAGRARTRA